MSEGTGHGTYSRTVQCLVHYIERTCSYNFQCNCKYDTHLRIFFPNTYCASFSFIPMLLLYNLSDPKAVGAAMMKGNVITYRIEDRNYTIYSKAIEVALRSYNPIFSHH